MEELTPQAPSYDEKAIELSSKIDRLKFLYDQYFLGRERIAPQTLRQEVDREMRILSASLMLIKNTATRFKVNSLKSKLNSFRRYWDRTMQQIEDGIYHRDRFRLKLYKREHGEEEPPSKTSKPEKTPPTAGKTNKNIEVLMNQWVTAKKKCKEPVKGINYQAFAKTIASQTKALKSRYKCKSIRFKVVIENGKTKLKATPR